MLRMSHWKKHIVLFQTHDAAVQRLAGTVCLEDGSNGVPCRGAQGKCWSPPAWGLAAAPVVPRGCSRAWEKPLAHVEGYELLLLCMGAAEPAGKTPAWLGFGEKQEPAVASSAGRPGSSSRCPGRSGEAAARGGGAERGREQPAIWRAQCVPA